ncbi:MAG TPA: class I SAM-dependent methyltransferase [Dehalococcoidia bacterium]
MPEYRYDDFWSRMGERYAREDPLGAVCWDGAPAWFNRFFAHFQVRAVRAALRSTLGDLRRDGRALDLGCGTGRWTRWLDAYWSNPVGVDISRGMLSAADPWHPYAQTDVTALPFRDGTFDFALSVTVLLHLPRDAQGRAIREIARVLKPGGSFLMLEMVNRVADRAHVFPNAVAAWQSTLRDAGFEVLHTGGEGYAPLLRAAFAAANRVGGRREGRTDEMKAARSEGAHSSAIGRLPAPAKLAARAAVAASYPLEYVLAPLLPDGVALNVCILVRKPAST